MSHQDFFQRLLAKTKEAFSRSDVNAKYGEKQWYYSVCASPIQPGKPVVLGINWGVGQGGHAAQMEMPSGFNIQDYDFIGDSAGFLQKYFAIDTSMPDFNYTNLCFFRTPSIKYLSAKDYKLSLPLFEEYVAYVQPPYLLSIGTGNFDVLRKQKRIAEWKQTDVASAPMQGIAARYNGIKSLFVPHPQARLTNEHRAELWRQTALLEI